MHGSEQLQPGYTFQGKMPGLSLLPQLGNQGHHLSPPSGEMDNVPQKHSFVNIDVETHVTHPIRGPETPFMPSDRRVIHDEERLERKRKVCTLLFGFLPFLSLFKIPRMSCFEHKIKCPSVFFSQLLHFVFLYFSKIFTPCFEVDSSWALVFIPCPRNA